MSRDLKIEAEAEFDRLIPVLIRGEPAPALYLGVASADLFLLFENPRPYIATAIAVSRAASASIRCLDRRGAVAQTPSQICAIAVDRDAGGRGGGVDEALSPFVCVDEDGEALEVRLNARWMPALLHVYFGQGHSFSFCGAPESGVVLVTKEPADEKAGAHESDSDSEWGTIHFVGADVRSHVQLFLRGALADQIVGRVRELSGDSKVGAGDLFWFGSGSGPGPGKPKRLSGVSEDELREALRKTRGLARAHWPRVADSATAASASASDSDSAAGYSVDPNYGDYAMLDCGSGSGSGSGSGRFAFDEQEQRVQFDTGNRRHNRLTVPLSEKKRFLALCTEVPCGAKQFELVRMLDFHSRFHPSGKLLRTLLSRTGPGCDTPPLHLLYQAVGAPEIKRQLLAAFRGMAWPAILSLLGIKCACSPTAGTETEMLGEPDNLYQTDVRYRIRGAPRDLSVRAFLHFAEDTHLIKHKYALLLCMDHIADLARSERIAVRASPAMHRVQLQTDLLIDVREDHSILLAAILLHPKARDEASYFKDINKLLELYALPAISSPHQLDERRQNLDALLHVLHRSDGPP